MNAVFKACLPALLLLIALSQVAHADNLPAPLMTDQWFSFLATESGDRITLRYNPSSVGDIPGIGASAREARDTIDRFYGGYPYKTTIVVAGDSSEFRLLINVGDAPDAVNARNWNVNSNGLVILKSPALNPGFEKTLVHQMARIAVRTRMNLTFQSLPEWYQDGVASFVAGDITDDQRYAATTAAATGTWRSLDELESAYRNMTIYNYDSLENRNARAQAAVFVDNVGTLYGSKVLIDIVDDYTVNGSFSRAFANKTLFTPDAMNAAYRNSLAGSDRNTSGNQQTGGTNNTAPGYSESPTKVPTAPVHQNTTATPATGGSSWLSTDDAMLYGPIAAVNAAGLLVVLLILRRNWH